MQKGTSHIRNQVLLPIISTLRESGNVIEMAKDMIEGGAVGLSILTETRNFKGNLEYMTEVREQINVPILMKDIFLDPVQIEAASRVGASAILLIVTLFERGYCTKTIQDMIEIAHSKNLEVLLETHTEDEFMSALKTSADLIGINNRNLKTLEVDLNVTKRILKKFRVEDKVVVSESGIYSAEDICALRECGTRAFLIGTSIMKSSNIKDKVKELVNTL